MKTPPKKTAHRGHLRLVRSEELHTRAVAPRGPEQARLVLGETVELVILACQSTGLRCRQRETSALVTVRTSMRGPVPGCLVRVEPTRIWTHGGRACISGRIDGWRLDVHALGLTPLALYDAGAWDPSEQYWGDEEGKLDPWAQAAIARGPTRMFELEQVMPSVDSDDPDPDDPGDLDLDLDSDPILAAAERHASGDRKGALELLTSLVEEDLRCLDAHAHLGNLEFGRNPDRALRHYRAGVAIGDLSLGSDFDGVLPWGFLDNRPFLRCLHGVGLSAWRAEYVDEAREAFLRLLKLNPGDNQGARFDLAALDAGKTWKQAQRER